MLKDNDTVTVCSKCFQASCWLGYFMCADAYSAGTVEKTVEELRELALEDEGWWERSADGVG